MSVSVMAFSEIWNYLPSVIIFNIYTYLSVGDRLSASSTCKSWRECLYHSSSWPTKSLRVNLCESRAIRRRASQSSHTTHAKQLRRNASSNVALKLFVAKCCRFVHNIGIAFDANSYANINDLIDTLELLSFDGNTRSLRRLTLSPVNVASNTSNWQLFGQLLQAIQVLIERCVQLEHISLGCLQHMLNHWPLLMTKLASLHSRSIKCLHISSVKQDPDYYPVVELSSQLFEPFSNIKMISIDYDNINDQLLLLLANKGTLETLVISVHGIDEQHDRLSKSSWTRLSRSNPNLKVTVNLIHTDDLVDMLRESLFDSDMPLTHFRAYFVGMSRGSGERFCSLINLISLRHCNTLLSATIIDNLKPFSLLPNPVFAKSQENPLVILAWRCKKLQSITIIGFEVCDTDLIAITRLRSATLKELKFPSCCISLLHSPISEDEGYYDDDKFYLDCAPLSLQRKIIEDIAKPLNREWFPMNFDELPNAVINPYDIAQTTYLPTLLMDQNSCADSASNQFIDDTKA